MGCNVQAFRDLRSFHSTKGDNLSLFLIGDNVWFGPVNDVPLP